MEYSSISPAEPPEAHPSVTPKACYSRSHFTNLHVAGKAVVVGTAFLGICALAQIRLGIRGADVKLSEAGHSEDYAELMAIPEGKAPEAALTTQKSHIILFLLDDVGWNDFG